MFGFKRYNYNPKSAENLKQNRSDVEPDLGKGTKQMTQVMDLVAAMDGMMEKREALINAKVEGLLASGYEPDEPDGLAAILAPIIEGITPVLPQIIERIVPPLQAGAVAGPTPSAAPAGVNPVMLIQRAATTPVPLLKAAMPQINAELEKVGVTRDQFKEAIQRLAKAV